MYWRILFLFSLIISVSNALAQKNARVSANVIGTSNNGSNKFYYGNRNEPPRAIEFKERAITTADFRSNFNRHVGIPTDFTFAETESNSDRNGMKHSFWQQLYQGIPLEGLGYRSHEKNGFMTSVNGKTVRSITLETQTSLSEEQAFRLAVKHLKATDTTFRAGKKLIVSKGFSFAPESFSVAFQFDIEVSLIERWRISIDARNGEVINKVSLVNNCFKEKEPPLPYGTGTGLSRYYGYRTIQVEKFLGGSSRLVGQTEHGGMIGTYDFRNASALAYQFGFPVPVYDFYSPTNTYTASSTKAAVSVQWAAEQAYEYYYKHHNRNSFDNNGTAITCYVHVDQGLDNAFWSYNKLLFGDGSHDNPLVELDVVSHELTHGVTQNEAALQYYGESGALNESFSDILGKSVEFATFGDTATWQMAKHYQSGGLRDLSNPNLRSQPDTYFGDIWYTGYDDSGGVHTNSGVQNFWFYLLCEGGNGVNDRQVSYAVKAIGIDTAAAIAYRNLTEYLNYASDYLDSRVGSLLAAADLYGKNSNAYQQVANAWDAVGVIAQPIITGQQIYDITATTVKIKGSLLPRGDTVTYHFEYGTSPSFGSSSSIYKFTDSVRGFLTALQSQTKYYLRLVATNENGSSYGAPIIFTTLPLTPLVKIKQTVDVTETTATLYGQVNPNSLSTSFYFEYGPTPTFGSVTPTYPTSDTTEFVNVSAAIAGLLPRQNYYFRLVAVNGFGSSATLAGVFFTAVKPVITSFTPVAAPTATVVTISGQNFNSATEKNLVKFGATSATVLSASPTEIKVKVPVGASLGPISLLDTESGLATESVQEFVPTFTGGFDKGNFTLRVAIAGPPYIWATRIHDMDADGKPDIVCIHYQGFSVYQNANQGGDITEDSFVRNTFAAQDLTTSADFDVVDFDGNGLKDVIAHSPTGLRIYPNFSVPGYIFFGTPIELNFGYFPSNVVYRDFDLDGRIDIAATFYVNMDTTLFTVVRNQNPKSNFSANNFVRQYTTVLPYYAYFMTPGDLNNDGATDLMLEGYNTQSILSLKNKSHPGAFDFEQNNIPDATSGHYSRYIAQDLNQDNWRDIIAHSPYETGNVALLENFGTSPDINMRTPSVIFNGYNETAIQPGDIDGDGKVDLMLASSQREFFLLLNKTAAGDHLSSSSFQNFTKFGAAVPPNVDTRMSLADLNGDGRPEMINAYSYNYGPHDPIQMEIWQNSPASCPDPTLVTVSTAANNPTVILPKNTTLDQYVIEYSILGYNYWTQISSTTLSNLGRGYTYQLRVRAKCYLGLSDYYYTNFTTNCVDMSSFSVDRIDLTYVTLLPYYISAYEIQYSLSGKNQWTALAYNSNIISGLQMGTTYDIRFRGRCSFLGDFAVLQFTTLCPTLSSISTTDITYNSAKVNWFTNYSGTAILEYSLDNITWTPVDATQIMTPLIPGRQYTVRGKFTCPNINSNFISTSFNTPCPKVSMLVADEITPTSARISWVDESKTGTYVVTYAMVSGGTIASMETTSPSVTLQNLKAGTPYAVSVAPKCTSNAFTSFVFNTECYTPFDLTVDEITHSSAVLTWRDNFGGPYLVDYSVSGSNVWTTVGTGATTLSLTKLTPGLTYEVRVHIICVSETPPYVSHLFETTLYPETTCSPNPTDGKVTLNPSKNLIGNHFDLFDNLGQHAITGTLLDYTIDLSAFPSGIYTLKIDGEKTIRISKY
ncbi:MAG TPA: M4 family metallopeptidase [Cyclobacteriaceae bacterium]|nr:M4 family metallopeptidase [Cyclobacteriaceae bacterium]